MSVVNKVLDSLERRGESSPLQQGMVHAVPQPAMRLPSWVLPVVVALLAGGGLGAYWGMRAPDAPTMHPAATELNAPVAPPVFVVSTVAAAPDVAQAVPVVAQAVSAVVQTASAAIAVEPAEPVKAASVPAPKEKPGALEKTAQREKTGPPEKTPVEMHPTGARPAGSQVMASLPQKEISPAQRADAEFRKAVALMQQGRSIDAIAGFEAALKLDGEHDKARQALVGLLLEQKRNADAERLLRERLDEKSELTGFAMLLARLQVERGALDEALATLERSMPHAASNADYQAFDAALLQRAGRHQEAVSRYRVALAAKPGQSTWLMGCGISLEALQQGDEAARYYRQALGTNTLSPELREYLRQRLRALGSPAS